MTRPRRRTPGPFDLADPAAVEQLRAEAERFLGRPPDRGGPASHGRGAVIQPRLTTRMLTRCVSAQSMASGG
jgi:hypothetical protein